MKYNLHLKFRLLFKKQVKIMHSKILIMMYNNKNVQLSPKLFSNSSLKSLFYSDTLFCQIILICGYVLKQSVK